MNAKLIFLVFYMSVFSWAHGFSQTTSLIYASDDAYLDYTTRYNNTYLKIQPGRRISYLKFSVATGGTVTNAILKLKCIGDGGNGTIRAYLGSNNNWTETTLTDANKPAMVSEISSLTGTLTVGAEYTWNLSTAITADGTYTIILVMDTGGNDAWFSSDEGSTQPELEISYSAPNEAPNVSITSPANGSAFAAGNNITISATAADSDGSVTKVEFYQGSTKLGEDTSSPYSYTWNSVAAGSYSITAKATDNGGLSTTSTAVSIVVSAPNQAPNVSITSPANGSAFAAGNNITISATAVDSDGSVTKVEFYQGSTKLGEDTSSPYSYTWNSVAAGSYSITAKATDNGGLSTTSSTVSITITSSAGTGNILREYWSNIGNGSTVASLTSNANFPDNPTGSTLLTSFEAPSNFGDVYGTRIKGYLIPPATGNYNFWIASDNASELWLSTTSNPESKVKICQVSNSTSAKAWTTYSEQASASIALVEGASYYIEALHKEAYGGDHLAVAWQGPGISQSVIAGEYLSTSDLGGGNQAPSVSITSPANNTTFTLGSNIIISATAADSDGSVTKVEFYQGSTKLGEDSSSPYSYTWSGVSAGAYSLTAKATDNNGATTTSSPVSIIVNPPPINNAPTINTIINQSVAENVGLQTIALSGIGDGDNCTQIVSVTAVSSNSGVANVSVNYSSCNSTGTLSYTPIAPGSATITVTVADDGGTENGGVDTEVITFNLTVTAVAVDLIPPAFISGYPGITGVTSSQANLNIQLNEAGTAFYMVLTDGASTPSVSQVVAGTALNITAANSTASVTISGLTANTAYDIYIVAQDDEPTPNVQLTPVKIDLTTSSGLIPTTQTFPVLEDSWVGEDTPNSNYNGVTDMQCGKDTDNSKTRMVYLKFNISSITGLVGSASIDMQTAVKVDASWTPVDNLYVEAFGSTNSWAESSITWNNKPAVTTSVLGGISVSQVSQYYRLSGTSDMTDYINAAVASSQTEISFAIAARDNTPNSRIWISDKGWQDAKLNIGEVDVTAPGFKTGFPFIVNTEATSLEIKVQLDEPGTVYYLVVNNGAGVPSVSNILSGGSPITVSSPNVDYSSIVTELNPQTEYDIYLIAQDDEAVPNVQANAVKLDAVTSTSDLTPPVFISGYPQTTGISSSNFSFLVKLDEPGTIFYMVKNDGDSSPSIATIVSSGTAVNVPTPNTSVTKTVTGLSPETGYDLYLIAQDNEPTPNVQSSSVKLDVTTTTFNDDYLPDVTVHNPLVITQGGVFENLKINSTDYDVPAIKVLTSQPVTIRNCVISGSGNIVYCNYSGFKITMENNYIWGRNPDIAGKQQGRSVMTDAGDYFIFRNNFTMQTGGLRIRGYNGSSTESVVVEGNIHKDLTSLVSNGTGLPGRAGYDLTIDNGGEWNRQMIILNGINVSAGTNSPRIKYNILENNEYEADNVSSTEDLINIFGSTGQSLANPIEISKNFLRGAHGNYPMDNYHAFYGTAIILDAGASGANFGVVEIHDNYLSYIQNAGICVSAGHDCKVWNNKLVNPLYAEDGNYIQGYYDIGGYLWAWNSAYPVSNTTYYDNFYYNNITKNKVPADYYLKPFWGPDCGINNNYCNNNTAPSTPAMTHDDVLDMYCEYLAMLASDDISVGPDWGPGLELTGFGAVSCGLKSANAQNEMNVNYVKDKSPVVNIYPNPAFDKLKVEFTGGSENDKARLKIFDIHGKIVLTRDLQLINGAFKTEFEIELIYGIYMLQINDGNTIVNKKVLVIK